MRRVDVVRSRFFPRVSGSGGFTLLEVIIASAIGMIVVHGLTSALVNQMRQTAFVEDKISRNQFETEVAAYLEDPSVCGKSLENVRVLPVAQAFALKDSAGQVIFNSTDKNRFDQLRILNMTVKNRTVSSPGASGLVEIEVTTESRREVLGPRGPFKFTLLQAVRTRVPGGEIVNCNSSSDVSGTGFEDGNLTVFNNPGYSNQTAVVADGNYAFCWIRNIANLENSHYCRVWKDTDGKWKMKQYKSGCSMNCLKAGEPAAP
ncbi:MAG: prepilin-type N-terminal cleavage/methylation domain-containing protein [Bdellovibrionaceae bacterium]|nr:prepilin-type N-terminal cleavage/methylation domain-containing protein [Pseudobdellovibrionaceae bacterium]